MVGLLNSLMALVYFTFTPFYFPGLGFYSLRTVICSLDNAAIPLTNYCICAYLVSVFYVPRNKRQSRLSLKVGTWVFNLNFWCSKIERVSCCPPNSLLFFYLTAIMEIVWFEL